MFSKKWKNSYEELVGDIIYVEEEPNFTNSTYTFIGFNENDEADDESDVNASNQIISKETKDYICGSCDDSFVHRKELDLHLQAKHPQIYNLINSYRKNEPIKENIEEHLPVPMPKIVIVETFFTCKCGKKFQKFLELEQHVEIVHSDEFQTVSETADENPQDELEYSEERVEESNDMIEEATCERNEESILVGNKDESELVDDEAISFVTIDEILSNRKSGGKSGSKIVRGSHICTYCGEKFYLKSDFIDHMREKHPDNPEFVCEICSKGFFDQYQLKKHRNVHNLKRFVCDICSKGFSTKSKLTVHLDVHFRRNTVDCEICGKTFAAKSGYRVHLKKHLGMWDKNIVCEICKARFRYQYNLDVHMKSHSGQKDFYCEICSKGFSLQRHLQAHMDSHNGLRKFNCETCGQKFIRRQTWRRHLITHTGEKAYKCQICNAAYVDRRSLRKHLEKIHPESNIEAFTKPLHSVPIIVEERTVTESKVVSTET